MYKILVVDDELSFLDTIAEILELEGYDVILAGDSQTALKLIQEQKPHLVITDILMPSMTGLELLKLSKADNSIRDIPFILLSGDTNERTSVDAQKSGAYSVVYKPFDVLKLLSVIETCLSSSSTSY